MRTAIIGNAGSGKSTLATAISGAARIAVLDLDTIFWARDAVAVPRPHESVMRDLHEFCAEHPEWVIEGCYGRLIEAVLDYQPHLLFLHPGRETCLANCRARPWERHKYRSKAEQDTQLDTLLAWVSSYYDRDDHMSLQGHQAIFDGYQGPKQLLTRLPRLAR
ncbi:hypothetical protein [Piscinibacter sakaiensis]|uniref:hypothetical protein n=1 Tax=Piscinibacter sakaiensis TaxID=1547922 RepID=UPI003AAE4DEE